MGRVGDRIVVEADAEAERRSRTIDDWCLQTGYLVFRECESGERRCNSFDGEVGDAIECDGRNVCRTS